MTNKISIVYFIILISMVQISAQQEVTLLGVEVDGNKLASETMIRYTAGLRQMR
ncbi:MAG: hypothetical protein CM1200mP10_29680 [Candidatus Neomarinimicrobiota bacterium]|nr:MAG: hypothetical protein CM1200mP10_29680 [Candidatus Neomarinimicrobiota bacterium]